jgi:hypothetical protein
MIRCVLAPTLLVVLSCGSLILMILILEQVPPDRVWREGARSEAG